MLAKLILFIIMLVVIAAFIGFNSGHTSDISIWFSEKGTFTDVPILVSFFVMYVVGVLSVIPFFVGYQYREGRKRKAGDAAKELKNEKTGGKARVLGSKAGRDESETDSGRDAEAE